MRKIIISVCLLGLACVVTAQSKKKMKKAKGTVTVSSTTDSIDYREVGAPLPELRVVTMDKKVITSADVKNDANLFVIMFNPTCEHCQEETMLIEKHTDLFKQSKVVLVAAPGMMQMLDFFESVTKASKYPLLQVGVDSAGFISKVYKYVALPQINIYDKDRKLVKIFNGDAPIDSLKQYIE